MAKLAESWDQNTPPKRRESEGEVRMQDIGVGKVEPRVYERT